MAHFVAVPFMLGVATASVQIEGGDRLNSWHDWARVPGRVKDGSDPATCVDHWDTWREDTDLMASMGIQTYRMSLEWSRIEPRHGEFDETAIERYREELQAIRDAGIVPLVTLHHFSNPRWFQDMGEFTNPESPDIFVRFVCHVVEALKDLVTDWVTINEPNVYVTQAHLFVEGPPGDVSWAAIRTSLRNLSLAHCRSYEAIHGIQPEANVGFAHHLRPFTPLNPRNPLHIAASKLASWLFQDLLTDAMLGGRFHPILGSGVEPGRYYDYIGINYYTRNATSGLADGVYPGVPVNDLGWEIYPQGLVEVARPLLKKYPGPIWVTENGTCDNGDGGQLERFRTRFLRDSLVTLAESGLNIERYYHWCFVDNWEWSEGMIPRFGLVHLDNDTMARTVKPSGQFYSEIIAAGGISEDMVARYVEGTQYPIN